MSSELQDALDRIEKLKERAKQVSAVGGRAFNPGWHLALDLRNMLAVAECMARAALTREESRGGHTRDDFPGMNPDWRKLNLICSLNDTRDGIDIERKPVPTMRADLLDLFEKSELKKYYTDEEIADVSEKVPDEVAAK